MSLYTYQSALNLNTKSILYSGIKLHNMIVAPKTQSIVHIWPKKSRQGDSQVLHSQSILRHRPERWPV